MSSSLWSRACDWLDGPGGRTPTTVLLVVIGIVLLVAGQGKTDRAR